MYSWTKVRLVDEDMALNNSDYRLKMLLFKRTKHISKVFKVN